MSLTIISDCHGQYEKYFNIVSQCGPSLQLGDFGVHPTILKKHPDYNPIKDKVFFGNHECYSLRHQYENEIGDYGVYSHGGVDFFFIRGAFSIDQRYRQLGIDWFPEEELTEDEFSKCFLTYTRLKPDIVISHDCPIEISRLFSNGPILRDFGFNPETFSTRTGLWLQKMFEFHQPRLHIFGHHHRSWSQIVNGTEFRCLNELETYTIEEE